MKPPQKTVQIRNRSKRLAGWSVFYAIILIAFIAYFYSQASKVNTLGFAPGTIELSVSKTKYTVGDTVSYTIKNNLSNSITLVNKCPQPPLHVYQWKNNTWNRLHDTAKASVCANQPQEWVIASGHSITQNYKNWPSLFNKPGIYRIVALANNYTALPYADFQVLAKIAPPVTKVVYKPVYTPVYTPIYVYSGGGSDGGGGGGDN